MSSKQANKQISKQANKQTSKQANKRTSKQANKRTNKKTSKRRRCIACRENIAEANMRNDSVTVKSSEMWLELHGEHRARVPQGTRRTVQ